MKTACISDVDVVPIKYVVPLVLPEFLKKDRVAAVKVIDRVSFILGPLGH